MSGVSQKHMYTLRPPYQTEFDAVVRFIFEQQAHPQTRCLHLDSDDAGIQAELKDLDTPFESAFCCAFENEQMIGLLGCEYDHKSGRGWLHGPFARQQDWLGIAEALFKDLWRRLPAEIGRVSNYLDQAHALGLAVHLAQGFVRQGDSHVYKAAARPCQVSDKIHHFELADAEALCALHAQAFPQTWINAHEMIAEQDLQHPILLCHQSGQVVGYARLSQHPALSEASLDFVAVAPAFRGQGLGRQLLEAALSWAFDQQQLSAVFLNVGDDNTHAKRLYQAAGFHLSFSGVTLDRYRSASVSSTVD